MRVGSLSAGALVVGLLVVASAAPGRGVSTGASRNVRVALVSQEVGVQPGHPFLVGVHMRMRAGWHTYWKNPGDAGLPLRIKWRLPEGFSAGPVQWPVPERISAGPVMSYGYQEEVLLPIEITPPSRITADSVTIAGTFDWLECSDVCLPGSSALDLTLPVGPEPAPQGLAATLFSEARSRMPRVPTGWSFSAEAGPRAISLALRGPSGFTTRGAYLFLDQPLIADFGAPQGFERIEGGYRLTMTPAPNSPRRPERLTGVLVFDERPGKGPPNAFLVDVPVSPGDPSPAAVPSARRPLRMAPYVTMFGLLCLGVVIVLRSIARFRRR